MPRGFVRVGVLGGLGGLWALQRWPGGGLLACVGGECVCQACVGGECVCQACVCGVRVSGVCWWDVCVRRVLVRGACVRHVLVGLCLV